MDHSNIHECFVQIFFVYYMYIYIYICFCIFCILLVFASHSLDHNLLHSFLDALNIPQWGVGRCREDWIQSFQPPKHQKTHGASSQSWNVAANPQESLRVQLLEGDLSTGKFALPVLRDTSQVIAPELTTYDVIYQCFLFTGM